MKQTTHILHIPLLAALALCTAGLMAAEAQVKGLVVKNNGQTVQAENIKWKAATKQYEITRGNSTLPLPLNQVQQIKVKPPKGLKEAIAKVKNGSHSGAHVITLEKIVKEYQMLHHDMTAAQYLITCYLETGRAEEAKKVMRSVMTNRKQSQLSGGFVAVRLRVLLENEQFATLEGELKGLIETGSRGAAASAQLMRGEIDRRKGDFRKALVGGYLRTVVLFADIKAVQPEALFKAAQCFEELGETPNAEKMRQKLLAEYPGSEYSRKLQSGG